MTGIIIVKSSNENEILVHSWILETNVARSCAYLYITHHAAKDDDYDRSYSLQAAGVQAS